MRPSSNSPHDLKHYLTTQTLVGSAMNVFLNGSIAWLMFRGDESLPLWGGRGFGFDLTLTALLLTFIMSWALIASHRHKVNSGEFASVPLDPTNPLHRLLRRMPRTPLFSALQFAAFGLFLVAPMTLLVLNLAGIEVFSPIEYCAFKSLWAGLLAAVIIRPMILLGIAAGD